MELRGRSEAVSLDRLKDQLLGEDEMGGLFQMFKPSDEPVDDVETKKLEEQLRVLEFKLLSSFEDIAAHVEPSANDTNFDLHLTIPRIKSNLGEFSVTVSPFNSEGVEPQELSTSGKTKLVFQNINESNLSRFLRFEIWQGKEALRTFLTKIEIAGLPKTRVSKILRSIINSRDRFFEYLRFLLTDDLSKEIVGTSSDDTGRAEHGEGGEIWDTSKPIFEQLLLSASRSPHRLKAIDDVIQQLRQEEADEPEGIVPNEFIEFWEAFKEIVPQQKRRRRV